MEDFRCPICCDLLYKPCVNSVCGHLFCFWCLHKAMSPYSTSHCPICRCKFGHFPAVCTKLHLLLQRHFPDAYAERERETQAEESELGVASVEVEPASQPASESFSQQELLCDSPACQRLLHQPLVLNCGHVVCAACARTDGAAPACPACGQAVPATPAVCKQLNELLQRLFPAEQAQRGRQEAAAAAATAGASAAMPAEAPSGPVPQLGAGVAAASCSAAEQAQQAGQRGAASSGATTGGGAPAGAAAAEPSSSAGEPTTPRGESQERHDASPAGSAAPVSPSLMSAIHRRRGEGAQGSAIARRLEDNLRALTGDSYVHHGVGCDICGMYPMQGRRYHCKDCPEATGFDLCGSCMDQGVAAGVGRFNQKHTAAHRMELVRPRITAMHMLQAANPELPVEQLMWLLELAVGRGDGDEEGEENPRGATAAAVAEAAGGRQQQQQQQAGQGTSQPAAGSQEEGEGDIPMPRWRGPRPAPDPTAEEPSPSAMAPDTGSGAAAGGGAAGGEAGDEGEDDASLVFIPLEALLGGGAEEEEENNLEVEEPLQPPQQPQPQQGQPEQ